MSANMQVCTFRVGHLYCGIPISAVQEVIQNLNFTRAPLASGAVCGLVAVRGDVLTVVDLRTRLRLPPPPPGFKPVSVIVRSSNEAISLWVDSVDDVIELDSEAGEDPPDTLVPEVLAAISKVYEVDGQLMLLLDPQRVTEVQAKVR